MQTGSEFVDTADNPAIEVDEQVSIPASLSPREKLVYVYLRSDANTDADQTPQVLRDRLGVSLLTLYPVLNSLLEEGHLARQDGAYMISSDAREGSSPAETEVGETSGAEASRPDQSEVTTR